MDLEVVDVSSALILLDDSSVFSMEVPSNLPYEETLSSGNGSFASQME